MKSRMMCAGVVSLFLFSKLFAAASFQELGSFDYEGPRYDVFSRAYGISADGTTVDGSVVVGYSITAGTWSHMSHYAAIKTLAGDGAMANTETLSAMSKSSGIPAPAAAGATGNRPLGRTGND